MSRRSKLDIEINKKALSFLQEFIKKLVVRKFQIISWGYWQAGVRGKYTLMITWTDLTEE